MTFVRRDADAKRVLVPDDGNSGRRRVPVLEQNSSAGMKDAI